MFLTYFNTYYNQCQNYVKRRLRETFRMQHTQSVRGTAAQFGNRPPPRHSYGVATSKVLQAPGPPFSPVTNHCWRFSLEPKRLRGSSQKAVSTWMRSSAGQ